MNFGMIMWNQNMEKKQNYVTWIYFFVYIKADDIYKNIITEDIETRFDASNYEFERPLAKD